MRNAIRMNNKRLRKLLWFLFACAMTGSRWIKLHTERKLKCIQDIHIKIPTYLIKKKVIYHLPFYVNVI